MIALSPDLKLPVDDAVTQTYAFLARRGAGKTYGASKLAEEFAGAGAQIVVLDPVGNWFGLRLDADGKSKGIDIPVFGGEHGDIPLEPTGGALVARAIVEHGTSVVLDVSHFRKNQRKQFCTDLAEELFHLKKSHRSPMHIFVEEAQVFVPQKTMHGEERMLGAFEDIIKLGRNYGIGATLISQRPQAINKDALNQTECLVVLQTSGAQERDALKKWMQEKDGDLSLLDELPSLHCGEAFVWSPSWLRTFKKIKIGKKWTLDASATPELGKHVAERTLAPIDLGALEAAMKETVERAKADDPRALRAEIAKLKAELAKQPDTKVSDASTKVLIPKTKVVEVPVLKEQQVHRVEAALGRAQAIRVKLVEAEREVGRVVDVTLAAMRAVLAEAEPLKKRLLEPTIVVHRGPPPMVYVPQNGTTARTEGVSGPQQRMLDALAAFEAIGLRQVSRSNLAAFSDQSPRSSGFEKNLSVLRTGCFIDYAAGSMVFLTDKGRASANSSQMPATLGALQAAWMTKVYRPQARMLQRLIAEFPGAIEREALATDTDQSPTSSGFEKNLSVLRSLGLVDYPERGKVAATDLLFPAGLS